MRIKRNKNAVLILIHVSNTNEYPEQRKSSVIRQKYEYQNECFKETKHAKFSKNEHFLPPDTHTYARVRIRG